MNNAGRQSARVRWFLTAAAVLAFVSSTKAVTATFEVRLAPSETDAVIDLSDPTDQVLDLELWVTLAEGPLPANGNVLAYSVFLQPIADGVITYNPGSFVNVLSQDLPVAQDPDNTPVTGAFSTSVGFLPAVQLSLGSTKLATFSVGPVGAGSTSYSFLDAQPARPWSLDFEDLTSATHLSGPPLVITVQSAPQAAHITGWQSVRSHSNAGELSIPLDPTAAGAGAAGPTVETREGGIQAIRVLFDRQVTLAKPQEITVSGRTTALGLPETTVPYLPSSVSMLNPTTLQISFAPGLLPDHTCYTISLSAQTVSPPLTGDLNVQVRSLLGDMTRDGEVNLSDALAARAGLSIPVNEAPQMDVDLSGSLTAADAVAAKSAVTSPPSRVFCDDPASVLSWRSVRTHGPAGPVAMALNMTAGGNSVTGPTVEAREGGLQVIEVQFNRAVTLLNPDRISIVGRSTTGSGLGPPVDYAPAVVAMAGSDSVRITLDPGVLPDRTCYTITLPSDLVSAGLIGDRDVHIRVMANDVTGDGRVTLSDVVAGRARAGAPVGDNPQFDVDLSGSINWVDAVAGKARVTSPAQRMLCP